MSDQTPADMSLFGTKPIGETLRLDIGNKKKKPDIDMLNHPVRYMSEESLFPSHFNFLSILSLSSAKWS